MKWERGDISFIFQGEKPQSEALTVLDNKAKVYQRVRYEETENEIEDKVDILMSSDILAAQMSTKDDLQKNKAIIESLTKDNTQNLDTNGEPARHASLNPPPESGVH
ncbi:unnamed protein product [Parnassius apollo]|uniref:(apollo) hypothetical protein n=1 Tax=Parnassius apollo TaxID=110799 RepID=A0A8S3XUR3_PARAO|nr:unnamed protein product [Parnassius apollo]